MSLNLLLQQQIGSIIDKGEWFVSITSALHGLTADQAEIKLPGEGHSVKELVIHITYWTGWYLDKYHGVSNVPINQSNEYTFTEECLGNGKISWDLLKEKLNIVLTGWQNELSVITEEKLLSVISNNKTTWLQQISSLLMHIVYHTGQIVCLRKLQANWDGKHGVS